MGEATTPSNRDKVVDVAIAEYNQLRAEVIGNQNRQGALVGIGLTAIGAIMTIALHDEGNRRLLLAVPPLALVLTLLHLGQARTITRIGDYIRVSLWPQLQKETGYPHSWEEDQFKQIRNLSQGPLLARVSKGAEDLAYESGPQILFAAIGLAALILAQPQRTWLIFDAACLVALVGVGVAFAMGLQRRTA